MSSRWAHRRGLGGEHECVADALSGLGRARLKLEDGTGAIGPLERALEILEQREVARKRTALTRLSLAKALVQAGKDPPRARALALKAREGYVESKGEGSDVVARLARKMVALEHFLCSTGTSGRLDRKRYSKIPENQKKRGE